MRHQAFFLILGLAMMATAAQAQDDNNEIDDETLKDLDQANDLAET